MREAIPQEPMPIDGLSNEDLVELYTLSALRSPRSEQVRHIRQEIARRTLRSLAHWAESGTLDDTFLFFIRAFTGIDVAQL